LGYYIIYRKRVGQ